MRNRLSFGISCAALLISACALDPILVSDPSISEPDKTERTYDREFGYVDMPDGVRLAYVAYLPDRDGPVPTILQYEPYWGAGMEADNRFVTHWLDAGYAFVGANVRGSGCSQGVLDLIGPKEGPDGAALIDWIAEQDWSDGSVGMVGVSYPGHTQITVAAQKPTALKAITPSAITASLYEDALYPGGIFNATFASLWSLYYQPDAGRTGAERRIKWGDTECAANRASHSEPTLVQELNQHKTYDEWMRLRSLETYAPKVSIPTFLSQSWQDNQTSVAGATKLFAMIDAEKRLTLAPGGHGSPAVLPSFQDDLLKWMDRWVRGIENGAEDTPEIEVLWEISMSDMPKAAWSTSYGTWPPAQIVHKSYYLGADGTLSAEPPEAGSAREGKLSYTYPIGVELTGTNQQFAVRPAPTGTLSWTTPAMTEDTTILGAVKFELYASSQNVDTDFAAMLYEIYPNGDAQFLQRGFLRASMRARDESSEPRFQASTPLVPDEVYAFEIDLPPLGAVIREGHSLQLVLAAPSTVPSPDWGLVPVDLPGRNTVFMSQAHPSLITLPIDPFNQPQQAAPECGSQWLQACRHAEEN